MDPTSVRVADAERDRTVEQLREHVVAGRLTLDECCERMGDALEATTRGDLEDVLRDLPAARPESVVAGSEGSPPRSHIAVMSGHATRGRWRLGRRTRAVAVMGGCTLDLRQAQIEGPEVEITATAFWGGIDIVVPEGFHVDLRGFSFMGGRSLRLRDVPLVPGSPHIVVNAYAVMGGVGVKSRPSRLHSRPLDRPEDPHGDPRGAVAPAWGDRVAAPATASDRTVTIVFCDMVGYATLTDRVGDQASHRILQEYHRIVRDVLARHGGQEISVQGDGFMVAFDGAARALRCAVDVQRVLSAHVPADGDEPIAVHVGIHTGDAVADGEDLLGRTVIVASRLADVAAPGEILVSSLSAQMVLGSGEFTFGAPREVALKGIAAPQPCSALSWE